MRTIKKKLLVDRSEINYLRWTLESYDGMAVVRTLDPHDALIEVLISPGCEELVSELLWSLNSDEGLNLIEPSESE